MAGGGAGSRRPRTRAARKPRPEVTRVLLLETDLDDDLATRRTQIPFMREFFTNYPHVELLDRQVHSRRDLEKFLDVARSDDRIRMLHIVAHGHANATRSSIVLTHGESVDLSKRENLRLFRDLHTEAIMLSCCELGSDGRLLRRVRQVSGADAVFSYARPVEDWQAYLVEVLLYNLAFGAEFAVTWPEVYERLRVAVAHGGIDHSPTALSRPLLCAELADSVTPAGPAPG